MCWALFMIGLHDDVQERIYEEMREIFGEDTQRAATFQDLNEMKYLERVIKETLRIYPSVPSISRKMNEDIVIGKQISFPTNIFVHALLSNGNGDVKSYPIYRRI